MRQSYKKHRLSNFLTFAATFLKVERVYGISLKTNRFREHIVILATLEKSWAWGAAYPLNGWTFELLNLNFFAETWHRKS